MGRIVVGVDGSEHGVDALRFALAEARAHGSTVEAVLAWTYPIMADAYGGTAMAGVNPEVLVEGAKQALEQAIEAATDDPAERAAVQRKVVEGGAGHALVEASRGAQLLVVGSRGHGGFTGLLLGSVSSQCVHHAHCPVVVVRPEAAH